eukprot:1076185-Prymnesium_polylepis.1
MTAHRALGSATCRCGTPQRSAAPKADTKVAEDAAARQEPSPRKQIAGEGGEQESCSGCQQEPCSCRQQEPEADE